MKRKLRVLLAGDHRICRHGFCLILRSQDDLKVVGETGNGREAVKLSESLKPDVVVMDVTLPELNSIEATRRIRKLSPRIGVLALGAYRDAAYIREMIQAGAEGYLLKDSADPDLVTAVRAVAKGDGYLSPEVSGAVLRDYRQRTTHPLDTLSARERGVLQLLAQGKTNKEIAGTLNLSVYTVDGHRTRIREKLNLRSVGELARFALRHGLID